MIKKSFIHRRFPKNKTLGILIAALLLMYRGVGFADSPEPFKATTSSEEFAAVIQHIADWVVKIGVPAVIFFIILTGIYFVLAQGNEEKLKKARAMLTWTLIGAVIIAGAAVIASAIIDFAKSLS
jgi:cytochrome b561